MSQKHLVLNDPHCLPTFQTKSWPDVSLVSFPLFPKIKDWVVDNDLNYGDHRLITITTDIQIPNLPRRRYKTKDTYFKKLNSRISKEIQSNNFNFKNIKTTQQFQDRYDEFSNMLLSSCNKLSSCNNSCEKYFHPKNLLVGRSTQEAKKLCKSTPKTVKITNCISKR